MSKSAKARAEALFSSARKKDDQVLEEKEKAQRDKADHVANLRALRLAKEEADKQAATQRAAKRSAGKSR